MSRICQWFDVVGTLKFYTYFQLWGGQEIKGNQKKRQDAEMCLSLAFDFNINSLS